MSEDNVIKKQPITIRELNTFRTFNISLGKLKAAGVVQELIMLMIEHKKTVIMFDVSSTEGQILFEAIKKSKDILKLREKIKKYGLDI